MVSKTHGMLYQKVGKKGRINYMKYSEDLEKFISHKRWDMFEKRKEIWGKDAVKDMIKLQSGGF